MAKIHAGRRELRASHLHLLEASTAGKGHQAAAGRLLLFYAAECGLKCALLRINNLWNTTQWENLDHDIDALIRELKVPKSVLGLGAPPNLRTAKRAIQCHYSDAHQAWRYGVQLESAGEAAFVKWLLRVCEGVQERI